PTNSVPPTITLVPTGTTTDRPTDAPTIVPPCGAECPAGATGDFPTFDCAGFHRCDAVVSLNVFPCSTGTLFDLSLGVCNWETAVTCACTGPSPPSPPGPGLVSFPRRFGQRFGQVLARRVSRIPPPSRSRFRSALALASRPSSGARSDAAAARVCVLQRVRAHSGKRLHGIPLLFGGRDRTLYAVPGRLTVLRGHQRVRLGTQRFVHLLGRASGVHDGPVLGSGISKHFKFGEVQHEVVGTP
ncbi:hypothetical protein ACHAWF_009265, partial [Thalassiosira exigua]